MTKAIYVLGEGAFEKIYGPDERRDIAALADAGDVCHSPEAALSDPAARRRLAEAEVILSGWGGPRLDAAFLDAAPNLRAFLYGAGATGHLLTPAVFERGVRVTSAAAANAVPVAEYTVAAVVFSLKQAFRHACSVRERGGYGAKWPVAGGYGSTVGLVSLGIIGRLVCERLAAMDVRVLAHDPFVPDADLRALGAEPASLEEVFRRSDVVSLHTPWLPETERLVRGPHFEAMKEGAAFINTARGAVVAEDEMLAVAARRPDLQFVLDVTYPEPPAADSPLFTLPNVFLTPHIAGSLDAECRRMGRYMVEELRRYLAGEPMRYEIRPETAAHTSHRPRG